MQVVLYKFTKRPNSTKEPSPNDATKTVLNNVNLKEDTSFLFPTLIFTKSIITGFNPVMFNYVTIPVWQRYYFIKDWRWASGVWECDLEVDVMATFKEEIGDTSAYIVRSASLYNGAIIDGFYPAKSDVSITKVNVSTSWYNVAPSGGTYVLGCINYETGSKIGSITYYALTGSQLGMVLNYLFQSNIFNSENIYDISQGLFKSMFNPFQYVASCLWFPFSTVAFGSSAANVKVGYWDTGVSGIVVTSLAEKTYVTATIPDHPQISRGNYLNHAPYTNLTLFIPPFGSIPIDTAILEKGKYLYSAVLVDHITGQATIRISTCADSSHLDEYNIITERSGMLGVPIQLSQIMPDYVGTVASIGNVAGSLLTGNIIGALGNVLNAVDSQMPKVSSSGANGSFIETLQYPTLIVEHLRLTDEDNAEYGRPLYSVQTIKTLSGYVQVGEDDHAFSGTDTECQMINKYMKSGFFYE